MENSTYISAASHSVEHPVGNWNKMQTWGVTMEEDEECLKDGHILLGELPTAKWNKVKGGSIEMESLKEDYPPSDLDEDSSEEELNGRQPWDSSMEEELETVKVRQATLEPAESPQIKWMQSRCMKVKEELGCRKETCGQQCQAMQQSPVVKLTLHKELTSLKQQNSDLIQKLRKKKDESRHLHNVTGRLCTAVDKETDMLQFLSKEMESISCELQQEHTWRLQLSDELQKYKNTLLVKIRTEISPNRTDRSEVEVLLKDKDHLTTELQKECNWKLQLNNELQKFTNVSLNKYQVATSTEVTKAHCQMLDSIPDEAFRISSTLMTELKKTESCSKQKAPPLSDNLKDFLSMAETGGLHQMFENLRNEVTKLSDILEEEMKKKKESFTAMPRNYITHQNVNYLHHEEKLACDVTQDESDEEENLTMTNLLLNQQLYVQNGIIANLEAERVKLSHRLETEVKKKNSLSKLRESDVVQLQQEEDWRVDLIYQLEKQVSDHQQELEALHQSVSETQGLLRELQALKLSNSKIRTRLHLEEELCHHFQTLSLRLTANLQLEKRKNRSLTDVLQKEQSSPEQRCHGCQREKERKVVGADSRDKCAKRTCDFFTRRRNKTKRQTESSL